MTIDPANAGGAGLVDRVKNIIMTPQAEWDRIEPEPADVNKLYMGYALPLIALAAVCGLIGAVLFGYGAFGFHYRVALIPAVIGAAIQVALGLAGVFLLAFITNALAPTFGSQQNIGQAHKLAVYGSTASFLAGVFAIFPPIAMLGIVGLYSLVLIYIGLPRLMKTPEDKRLPYFLTIIVIAIVAWFIIGAVLGSVRMAVGGMGAGMGQFSFGQQQQQASNGTQDQGTITLPGGGTIDVAALEKQAQAYQDGAPAIDPARLERYTPQSLPGGFQLTSKSTSSAMGAAVVEAVYENGDRRIELTLTHMGAMGAIASFAQAANVQESRSSADGFTRTNTVDGRVYNEEVSTSGGRAKYAVVGHGVAISAEGSGGVDLDQVRAAVETIGITRLEGEFD